MSHHRPTPLRSSDLDVAVFSIDGPLLFTPRRIADARGWFAETFREDVFQKAAGPVRFVQDNQSFSAKRGALRGLHFQTPPNAQGKLVRVLKGAIFDVAVDARPTSSTYGQHIAVEIDADRGAQLWVPTGFLHGFCTLTDDCEVTYKVTDYYSREHDGSVAFDDPDLGIDWPVAELLLSEKDRAAPRLKDVRPFG